MLSVERKAAIRELRLTVTTRECTREKTCANCGGPISPGEWEVPVDSGLAVHTHCADDLEIELR